MRPYEVALVVGKMRSGGVQATVLSYIKNINPMKIHFTLLVDEDSTFVPEEFIRSCGADLRFIPPYQHILSYQKELQKIFRQTQFDVVHAHLTTLSVFPLFAAACAKIPVRIVHAHSTAGKGKGETKRNVLKYILRPFAKIFATELCACSEYAGKWLFGPRAVFTIIPNAIDFESEKYIFNPDIRKRMREKLRINECFVIGHVGRFVPAKNHVFILDIFSHFLKKVPNAYLILVGEGNLLPAMKKKAQDLGIDNHVLFAGRCDNVNEFYQAMDVFLFPSLYEGLGYATMEAQISGLPVIVADNISKEIILKEDLIHFLSLKASAETWAEAIERIIPFTNVEDRAVHCEISKDDAAIRLEQFYMNIINRRI